MAIIDDIYEALLDEEAMEALPGRLAGAVGARSSTFQIYEGQTPVYIAASYFSPEMTQFYLENNFATIDCWTSMVAQHGLFDRAIDADRYMSREDFRATPFHNEFFRRFGDDTGYSMGAVLRTRSGMVGLGLHHALSAKAYGDRALDTLNSILPHLRRLAEARAVITLADTRTRDAEALLHAQATAILLVDDLGVIAFSNTAAEGLLALDDGLGSRCGVLRASGPQAGRLEAAIRRAAGAQASGDALVVDRRSGNAGYRLLVAPHRGPGARPGRAMIMIEDPSSADPDLAARLRLMFDLTGAEADLMVRLVAGETLSEASDARRVLVSTSRSQLNAVLSKTGLRRQGELLAMIARLPRLTQALPLSPK